MTHNAMHFMRLISADQIVLEPPNARYHGIMQQPPVVRFIPWNVFYIVLMQQAYAFSVILILRRNARGNLVELQEGPRPADTQRRFLLS